MIITTFAEASTQTLALGPSWLNADELISSFGSYALIGIVLVIFIETGLLFPLLPGDSLLFTAGALVAQGTLHFPLWLLCVLLFLAAFLGDQNAYWIGRRSGPKLFNRPDSKFFKKKHLDQTAEFFDRHGGKAIILARFVPFVRTYSAVSAGMGRMHYRTFVIYDAVGAFLWAVGVTLLGYWLGNITFVKDNIELLLLLVVAVSVLPVAIELARRYLKSRKLAKNAGTSTMVAPAPVSDGPVIGGPVADAETLPLDPTVVSGDHS